MKLEEKREERRQLQQELRNEAREAAEAAQTVNVSSFSKKDLDAVFNFLDYTRDGSVNIEEVRTLCRSADLLCHLL